MNVIFFGFCSSFLSFFLPHDLVVVCFYRHRLLDQVVDYFPSLDGEGGHHLHGLEEVYFHYHLTLMEVNYHRRHQEEELNLIRFLI